MNVAKFVMSSTSPDRSRPNSVDHPPTELGLDRGQVGLAEAVHRVPEPAVVQRRLAAASPTAARPWWPTSRRTPASSTAPPSGSPWPTPCTCPPTPPASARRGTTASIDPDHVQASQHRPHRRQVTEPLVLAANRRTRRRAGQLRRDLRGAAQILLRHDPRLAIHPGGLDQVVVRLSR